MTEEEKKKLEELPIATKEEKAVKEEVVDVVKKEVKPPQSPDKLKGVILALEVKRLQTTLGKSDFLDKFIIPLIVVSDEGELTCGGINLDELVEMLTCFVSSSQPVVVLSSEPIVPEMSKKQFLQSLGGY